MPFEILEGPDGKPVTAKGDADGLLRVAVDSMPGGGDASAANQLTQIAAEEATQAAVEALAADPPTGTLQSDTKATLDVIQSIVATDGSVLTVNASVQDVVTVVGFANASLSSIDSKLPTLAASDPSTSASAVPVRQVPAFVAGKQLHVQTDVGIANGANKLLLGFTNNTGQTAYVTKVAVFNAQTAGIAGVMTWLYIRRGTTAITGGTTLTTLTSPAIVPSMRDPSQSIPAGFTWNTNGTLGGTITTIESTRWTTEEVGPTGSGLAELTTAVTIANDIWNFEDDPIVVPNGQSLAIVCDATATNGQTLVDFNIRFAQ